jgi:hypothetical protein
MCRCTARFSLNCRRRGFYGDGDATPHADLGRLALDPTHGAGRRAQIGAVGAATADVTRTEHRTRLQERIAALAARHMAEDGEEAERAKHKAAAALLGDSARREDALPDNEQLRVALREHLRNHGGPAHRAWLRRQRHIALEWMERLQRFEPHLVGAVLDASATREARVELDLYADSAKDVEMALLDLGIHYRVDDAPRQQRHVQQRIGFYARPSGAASVPVDPGTPVVLTVNDPVALRSAPGARHGGRHADPLLHPVEQARRADAAMLRRLLDETAAEGPDLQAAHG